MVLKQAHEAPAVAVMEEVRDCRHHWVIEPANGRYSRGECRKCHETKAFENSVRDPSEAESE